MSMQGFKSFVFSPPQNWAKNVFFTTASVMLLPKMDLLTLINDCEFFTRGGIVHNVKTP